MMSDIFMRNCAMPYFERHAVQFVRVDQYMNPGTHKGRVSEVRSCEFPDGPHLKDNVLVEYERYVELMSSIVE
eukprot:5905326-Ditylum_brightwellii.AAC.1